MKDLTNLPLTKNQKRLWIAYLQDKSSPAYNLKLTYHLKGELDIEKFKQSLGLLFRQQHSVFSVFRQKDGIPHVEIRESDIQVVSVDYSGNGPEESRRKVYEHVASDSRKPLDLENGPLFRLYLLKAGENDHYFHATIHHIIFDGFSRRVFVQELSRIYNCLMAGDNVVADTEAEQSYDYAGWEMQTAPDHTEEKMIDFWKENLKDIPAELKFPYDYARKNNPSGFGYRESFEVPADISLKLKKLGSETGATPFETLLAAIGVLMNKYTGEDDICIGIPVSTRLKNPRLWKMFGYFVNTSIVRLRIDEEKGFRNLVRSASASAKDAVVNSNLPFEKIVEVVKPHRVPGMNPLFQVSLSWFTNFTVPMKLGDITGERINVSEGVAPGDIAFLIWENEGKIQGEIEYNIDLLRHETIVRFRENMVALLGMISDYPDRSISELTAVSVNELKLIDSFNKTETPLPDLLIHNLFERQVPLFRDKIAVMSLTDNLTYGELDRKANQMANYLLTKGVAAGEKVGLSLDRSCGMLAAILGILKTGCCYVPLDPSLPGDRLSYMLEDAGARFLVTQESLLDKYRSFGRDNIVLTDSDSKLIEAQSAEKPADRIGNQAIAYMIYTSGSTGRPKGVMVHHQAAVNFLLGNVASPGFGKDDRILAATTLSFDISVTEMFLPLATGGQSLIVKTDVLTDGQVLAEILDKYDITLLQTTPVTYTLLTATGWKGKPNMKAFYGGEPMARGLIMELLPKVAELWNMYGPTETTVAATGFRITDPSATVYIGKPMPNTRIYILDKYNKPLPVGCIGELCIGGLGVSKGYNNNPELTSQKFINLNGHGLIYKTGDLARFVSDGNLELFGRMDNQVKIRGFRIETGEIESLLLSMKNVREAVVRVQNFGEIDRRLVAFLNVEDSFSMTNEEISKYLGQSLPVYMIPSFYQRMEAFPRMPNGKINTRALVYIPEPTDQHREEVPADLTPTQKILTRIFGEVLKTQKIKLDDNFFDLGGNSLLAIAVFSKLEAEFRVQFSLRLFFDSPCVRDLAEVVDFTLYRAANPSAEKVTGSSIIKGEI